MLIKANKRENRLNLKILFLLCVFIILTMVSRTLPAAGADGSWRSMEAMPSERWDTSAVVIREKIYVIGKIEGRTPCIFSVTEYNPVKNSWRNVIKYSRCFTSMTAAVVRGKIYVIGGMDDIYNQYSWVWEHNPVIGSWRNMADMLTRRSGLAAVAVREKNLCHRWYW